MHYISSKRTENYRDHKNHGSKKQRYVLGKSEKRSLPFFWRSLSFAAKRREHIRRGSFLPMFPDFGLVTSIQVRGGHIPVVIFTNVTKTIIVVRFPTRNGSLSKFSINKHALKLPASQA